MLLPIRSMTEADYTGIAALATLIWESPTSVDSLRWDLEHKDPRCLDHWLVAEKSGVMVGYAEAEQWPGAYHPQKFHVRVTVHPDHRRQGVGSALYKQIMGDLAPFDPISVSTTVREDWPDSQRFVAARGFTEVMRYWDSYLNPQEVDLTVWAPFEQRVAALGYEIRSYNELAADPELWQKLYALTTAVRRDVPMFEPLTDVSYEQWVKDFADPYFWGDGFFVALKDSQMVGLSTLWHSAEADVLSTDLTAVHRAHRGIGLAKALKAQGDPCGEGSRLPADSNLE